MSSERFTPSASTRSSSPGTLLIEAGTSKEGCSTLVAVTTMLVLGGVSAARAGRGASEPVKQSTASALRVSGQIGHEAARRRLDNLIIACGSIVWVAAATLRPSLRRPSRSANRDFL